MSVTDRRTGQFCAESSALADCPYVLLCNCTVLFYCLFVFLCAAFLRNNKYSERER